MSVIGIDVGSANCVIAHASRKGVVTVLNEATQRRSSNLISFRDGQRHLASDADSVARGNYKNSVWFCNRLLGHLSEGEKFEEEIKYHPYRGVFGKDAQGRLVATMQYGSEKCQYRPVQLVSMLLGKLQRVVMREVKGVPDVVITVPSWFDDRQRRLCLAACEIANVRCLQLLNDNVAVALQYGIWKNKKGLFDDGKKHHALFLDMGASQFTCTAAKYEKGVLQILASASDKNLGGRLIDLEICKYLAAEFKAKTGNDVMTNPKSLIKLMQAAQKAKHNVCGGVPSAAINVECLMNDADLNAKLSREKLAEIMEPLLPRLVVPLKRVLSETGMEGKDFDLGIECVGGSMRAPAFVREAAKVLGTDLEARNCGLSRTLDMDEAAAHGACLQCAMKSPNIRLQTDFAISDAVPLPVELSWDSSEEVGASAAMDVDENDNEEATPASHGPSVMFERNSKSGLRKITLKRDKNFKLKLQYHATSMQHITTPVADIVSASITGMPEGGEATKCKCVVQQDASGLYTFHSAYYIKKVKVEPTPQQDDPKKGAEAEKESTVDGDGDAKMDSAGAKDADGDTKMADETENSEAKASDAAPAAPEASSSDAAKAQPASEEEVKFKNKRVHLQLDINHLNDLPKMDVMELQESEAKMAQADRLIKEKDEARNSIETFVYEYRSEVSEYGTLKNFCNGEEKTNFLSKLQEAEDWLYSDEGFDANKATLDEKLSGMKAISAVFVKRQKEDKDRPAVVEQLKSMIGTYLKKIADDDHAHLTDEDKDIVKTSCNAAEGWLHEQVAAQEKLPTTVDPVLVCADILAKGKELSTKCDPVVNKPKPKPAAEDKASEAEASKSDAEAGEKAGETPAASDDAGKKEEADAAAAAPASKAEETADADGDVGMSKE